MKTKKKKTKLELSKPSEDIVTHDNSESDNDSEDPSFKTSSSCKKVIIESTPVEPPRRVARMASLNARAVMHCMNEDARMPLTSRPNASKHKKVVKDSIEAVSRILKKTSVTPSKSIIATIEKEVIADVKADSNVEKSVSDSPKNKKEKTANLKHDSKTGIKLPDSASQPTTPLDSPAKSKILLDTSSRKTLRSDSPCKSTPVKAKKDIILDVEPENDVENKLQASPLKSKSTKVQKTKKARNLERNRESIIAKRHSDDDSDESNSGSVIIRTSINKRKQSIVFESKKIRKKRRGEIEMQMDIKDMVVTKRTASLNASAIMYATYCSEPRKSTKSTLFNSPTEKKKANCKIKQVKSLKSTKSKTKVSKSDLEEFADKEINKNLEKVEALSETNVDEKKENDSSYVLSSSEDKNENDNLQEKKELSDDTFINVTDIMSDQCSGIDEMIPNGILDAADIKLDELMNMEETELDKDMCISERIPDRNLNADEFINNKCKPNELVDTEETLLDKCPITPEKLPNKNDSMTNKCSPIETLPKKNESMTTKCSPTELIDAKEPMLDKDLSTSERLPNKSLNEEESKHNKCKLNEIINTKETVLDKDIVTSATLPIESLNTDEFMHNKCKLNKEETKHDKDLFISETITEPKLNAEKCIQNEYKQLDELVNTETTVLDKDLITSETLPNKNLNENEYIHNKLLNTDEILPATLSSANMYVQSTITSYISTKTDATVSAIPVSGNSSSCLSTDEKMTTFVQQLERKSTTTTKCTSYGVTNPAALMPQSKFIQVCCYSYQIIVLQMCYLQNVLYYLPSVARVSSANFS